MRSCVGQDVAGATYGTGVFHTSAGRIGRAMWVLTCLLLLQAGCSSPETEDRIVTDALGRSVHLEDSITRVITLAPNLTEIVFAAGAGHRLAGVGRPDDFPPQVDTLPRYSTYPLDFEAVAALGPDLALASDQVNGMRDAEALGALGIPTIFLSSGRLDEIFESIERVGRILDTGDAARRTTDSLRQRVEMLRALTRDAEKPLTLFLIGQETLFSFGSESYMHDLIELAGGRSATGGLEAEAPILSEEFVLTIKPEVIIGPWGDGYEASQLLEYHSTWDVLPAVVQDRVYGVDADIVERPGPRLVEGAWAMARKIHPELFDGR